MPRAPLNARQMDLKQRGHDLIDELVASGIEPRKVYRALSSHMGFHGHVSAEMGFHFRHEDRIWRLEKAVAWLEKALEQGTLSPRIRRKNLTWEGEHGVPAVVVLKQEDMRKALERLRSYQQGESTGVALKEEARYDERVKE